jgi:hypothetical protein
VTGERWRAPAGKVWIVVEHDTRLQRVLMRPEAGGKARWMGISLIKLGAWRRLDA